MARIYIRMIQSGRLTLADVPPLWRAEVESALNA